MVFMADRRVYSAPGIDVRSLADAISNWFKARDFETQIMMAPGGGYMIQARQPSGWRSVLGLSSALLVTLIPKGDGLEVTTAAAKWADKVAVGAVGLVIHPLLITAGYGAWKQSRLPDEIFEMISLYLPRSAEQTIPVTGPAAGSTVQESTGPSRDAVVNTPASASSSASCPSCGHPASSGASYCSNCGAKLKKSFNVSVE